MYGSCCASKGPGLCGTLCDQGLPRDTATHTCVAYNLYTFMEPKAGQRHASSLKCPAAVNKKASTMARTYSKPEGTYPAVLERESSMSEPVL